jgi:hypothetical protein
MDVFQGRVFLCIMDFPAIDSFFQKQQEPARSTLIWLREHIKKQHPELEEKWRYGMPFFDLDGRMFCYLWCASSTGTPYIGFVDGAIIDHPALVQGERKRMKIFLVDPTQDAPVEMLNEVLAYAVAVRKAKAAGQPNKGVRTKPLTRRSRRTG